MTPLEVADALERPTERDQAAIRAIREAASQRDHWRSMAEVHAIQIAALLEENRRLREQLCTPKP